MTPDEVAQRIVAEILAAAFDTDSLMEAYLEWKLLEENS